MHSKPKYSADTKSAEKIRRKYFRRTFEKSSSFNKMRPFSALCPEFIVLFRPGHLLPHIWTFINNIFIYNFSRFPSDQYHFNSRDKLCHVWTREILITGKYFFSTCFCKFNGAQTFILNIINNIGQK